MFYQIYKDHITLSLKVVANAARNELKRCQPTDELLVVKIRALREKGKANEDLIVYFRSIFQVPQKDIVLFRGATTPLKILALHSVSAEKLRNVLGI